MSIFEVLAITLCITALFGYVNVRFLKLPNPIGVTLIALILSFGFLLFGGMGSRAWAERFLELLNFNDLVLQGLLSFLLFAGSLTVNLDDLNRQKGAILILATLGVVISTFVVGILIFVVAGLFGLELPFLYALLFGALISPTDPIAVLSILRRTAVPKDIETLITGESLFNDGIGVVVFSVILSLVLSSHGHEGSSNVAILLLQEAGGGIVFGMIIGYIAYLMLKSIDEYSTEILITLALVTGGYALAQGLHTSGPLAMVVAGLFIGNRGRLFAMSERTREHLFSFWEMIDEILNAILFVLIGLEILVIRFTPISFAAALIAIPIVLLARFISVGGPISLLRLRRNFLPYTVRIMIWGGLRGGISIALALSLPASEERNVILNLTYAVVVFAILMQGLTVGQIAKRIPKNQPA